MDLETFRDLLSHEGQRLLSRIVETDHDVLDSGHAVLSLSTRLRRDHPAPLVAAALTQIRLRARARAKFGADAARMYFTAEGLEQATRGSVAELRARRYRSRGGRATRSTQAPSCVDLCCGIGGDLIALARAGCRVEGVERDPLTAEVARANVEALGLTGRAVVHRADAEAVDPASYDTAFCDPARRTSGARVFDPQAYSPPLPRVLEIVRSAPGGGAKVAPGIPHHLIPSHGEAEWVSVNGDVKEAALWFGDLAGDVRRRATVLPSGAALTEDPSLGDPPVAPPSRYLYEPDGAVIRAGLVGEAAARVHGTLLDPTIAFFSSEHHVRTPYARSYEVTEVLPFSLNRLRSRLRALRVGRVTIKKRGSAVDVERLRRDLKLSGNESATVVLTRIDGVHHALLCHPLPATSSADS